MVRLGFCDYGFEENLHLIMLIQVWVEKMLVLSSYLMLDLCRLCDHSLLAASFILSNGTNAKPSPILTVVPFCYI